MGQGPRLGTPPLPRGPVWQPLRLPGPPSLWHNAEEGELQAVKPLDSKQTWMSTRGVGSVEGGGQAPPGYVWEQQKWRKPGAGEMVSIFVF